jgi:hypothetical protein
VVIAGPDPAIHHLRKRMDARVKPAHDKGIGSNRSEIRENAWVEGTDGDD